MPRCAFSARARVRPAFRREFWRLPSLQWLCFWPADTSWHRAGSRAPGKMRRFPDRRLSVQAARAAEFCIFGASGGDGGRPAECAGQSRGSSQWNAGRVLVRHAGLAFHRCARRAGCRRCRFAECDSWVMRARPDGGDGSRVCRRSGCRNSAVGKAGRRDTPGPRSGWLGEGVGALARHTVSGVPVAASNPVSGRGRSRIGGTPTRFVGNRRCPGQTALDAAAKYLWLQLPLKRRRRPCRAHVVKASAEKCCPCARALRMPARASLMPPCMVFACVAFCTSLRSHAATAAGSLRSG
mmetsp:Transcript_51766/g.150465  ORF Transcript_51766/g.150465 Transcript_51766/m.150465 type:complete len:296 (-) Transcript_51766:19-906(-)